jgi:multidrug transporter EmrE-like cation transporter
MGLEPGHPRAEPHLWPVVTMGAILATQVALMQVAVNRLAWGMYDAVFSPAVAVAVLAVAAWILFSQLDRDTL